MELKCRVSPVCAWGVEWGDWVGVLSALSPVRMRVGSRGLPRSRSTLIFEAGFHPLNLKITSSARLTGHGALGILLFKLTQCWDCKVMLAHWDLSRGC